MKDGEHIGYYLSGLVRSKRNYLGGKLNGEFIKYYDTGGIYSKYNWLGGKKHGEHIEYYKSGDIWYKSYYIYGKFITELDWISYNRNIKLELLGL